MKKAIACVLLVLCWAVPSRATVYYVDGENAGAEDGSQANPYDTIAEGLADCTEGAGDTVYIDGGQTYSESNLAVNASGASAGAPTVIMPWPGNGDVTIDGDYGGHPANNRGFIIQAGDDYVKIQKGASDGLIVRDFERAAVYCIASNGNESDNITVDGPVFINNNTDGTYQGSLRFEYCDYLAVQNIEMQSSTRYGVHVKYSDGDAVTDCLIDGNTIYGVAKIGSAYGVFWDSGTYCTISDNTIYFDVTASEFRAIQVTDASSDNSCTDIHVTGNTCYNSGTIAFRDNSNGITFEGVHSSQISGNTCYNWTDYGIDVGGGGTTTESLDVTIEKNLCYNNYNANIEGDAGEGGHTIVVRNNLSYTTSPDVIGNHRGFGHHDGDVNTNGDVALYNNSHYGTITSTQGFKFAQLETLVLQNNSAYCLDKYALNIADAIVAGGSLTIDYNNWYAASGNAVRWINDQSLYTSAEVEDGTLFAAHGIDENSLGSDPLYVNPESDMSVGSDSPNVDAGTTIASFSDDYLGDTRPGGSAWDIGAYEYQAAAGIQVWYISQSAGSDSNPFTEASPGSSFAAIADSGVGAGDFIMLKRGDTWNETFTVNWSGSSGSRITITSYSSGALPIISGQDSRDYCMSISGKSYITVEEITFRNALKSGLVLQSACDDINIRDCTAHACKEYGLFADSTGGNSTNVAFRRNTCYDDSTYGGIGFFVNTAGRLNKNLVYNCGDTDSLDHGIVIAGNNLNVVAQQNMIYGNRTAGIFVDSTTTALTLRYNITYSNGFAGIWVDNNASGIEIYNHTSYSDKWGLALWDDGDDVTVDAVKNCIFNSSDEYGVYLRTGGGTATITAYTNNDVFGAVTDNYSGMADPTGTNGNISSDPSFFDVGSNSLSLAQGSPCIGAGADLGVSHGVGVEPDAAWPASVRNVRQDDYGAWEMGAFVYMMASSPPGDADTATGGAFVHQ
jgi:hypothetical protein